jgi:hypothetical protein
MLRYSVDEENVGGKEIEARSKAQIERFCQKKRKKQRMPS